MNLESMPAIQFLVDQGVGLLGPELILLFGLLFAFWPTMASTPEKRDETYPIALMTLVICLLYLVGHLVMYYLTPSGGISIPVLYGMLQMDTFAALVRLALVSGSLIVLMMAKPFLTQQARPILGEFCLILMTALLGAMLLASANDLMMVFVSLETLGIASYVMAGFARQSVQSAESAMKYLVYGGASTAFLTLGMSFLYALGGGHTQLPLIMEALQGGLTQSGVMVNLLLPLSGVLILAGVAFKLSVAPFHVWTPDVYEGAPTPVTAFLSVVSKTAGFALATRLFSLWNGLGTVPSEAATAFSLVLSCLAVLSMVVGNTAALLQKDIKRMLAYSTIAHAGYLLLGLVLMGTASLSTMLFYLFTYLFMNLGAFAVVAYVESLTGSTRIADYAGLVKRRPFLSLAFSFFLLSLAGIPITAGFFAKFFLFQAVALAGPKTLWLVVVALLTSTVSLYYYLTVIRLMVVAEPSDCVKEMPAEPSVNESLAWSKVSSISVAIGLMLIGTIALGFLASPVMSVCESAVAQFSRTQVPSHTALAR